MWTRGASWRAPACVLSVAVAAVVCAGAAPYADVARAAEPVADEFYTPPSRLSGMRPGDVIQRGVDRRATGGEGVAGPVPVGNRRG